MTLRANGDAGRRLRDSAPALYRTVAPAARAARRCVRVALDSTDVLRARVAVRSWSASEAPRPRIVLDAVGFEEPLTGIARVWRALMTEWSRTGFSAHVTVLDRGATAPRLPGFTYLDLPRVRAADTTAQRRLLQDACDAAGADLFVSTAYSTPLTTPSLLLVLDFTPEHLGWDTTEPAWREKRRAVERAVAYVSISRNTASDLARFYPGTRGRPSDVALLGVDEVFHPAAMDEVSALRARLDLPERYFVFMGHRDGYKNAELLFEAIAGLGAEPEFGLLLVGGAPELEPRFSQAARDATVRVVTLDDDELRTALSGAVALLYLSRYEGFGLPIIEAMACGCPVISTGGSSLPEAAGHAAITVGEDDPQGLRAAMQRVSDPDVRVDLVSQGLAHSAEFTWTRTASVVQAAMERAVSAPTPAAPAAPLVSILTPSFNQATWLPDNLRSVACQTYPRVEHIVADGGSIDGSVAVLEAAGDTVSWVSEPDTGQPDAINKAFRQSSGDIIGWINSDDAYFDCRVVADIVAYFVTHPEVDVVFGHLAQIDEHGTIVWLNWVPQFSNRLLRIVNFIGQPVAFIRRSVLSDPMLDETYHFAMDYELWLRLQAAGRRFHRIGRITAVDRHQATRKSETIQHVLVSDLGRLAQTHGRGYPRGKRALSWGFYTWRRFMGGFLIPRVPRALAFTDARTSRWALLRRQWFSWNKAWPSDWDPDRR